MVSAENIYEEYDQFRAVINSSGTVHWEPGGVFKTMCVIDITYYPFDDQTCRLTFGAWSYHTAKMNLTNDFTSVNLDSYSVSHISGYIVIGGRLNCELYSYDTAKCALMIQLVTGM